MFVIDKMEIDLKLMWGIIIIVFFIIGGIGFYHISITGNNWWVKLFCIIEDGKLQQKYFKDICWIDNVGYIAEFVGTGEYYSNLTPSDEIYKWKLVEVKTE